MIQQGHSSLVVVVVVIGVVFSFLLAQSLSLIFFRGQCVSSHVVRASSSWIRHRKAKAWEDTVQGQGKFFATSVFYKHQILTGGILESQNKNALSSVASRLLGDKLHTYIHTYFIVTSLKGLFRNNDYITLFIITDYNT